MRNCITVHVFNVGIHLWRLWSGGSFPSLFYGAVWRCWVRFTKYVCTWEWYDFRSLARFGAVWRGLALFGAVLALFGAVLARFGAVLARFSAVSARFSAVFA